jgi:hypothetical protein
LKKESREKWRQGASAFTSQTLETTKILKNFYHKGASTQGSICLRGGYFLQELYDFEKILAVKKANADTLGDTMYRIQPRKKAL